jgi:hypothetical protein
VTLGAVAAAGEPPAAVVGRRVGAARSSSLPQLSTNVSEVVDFVGAIVRVFRGDWNGAEQLMDRVIENGGTPNELRTDAYLYKGLAAAQQSATQKALLLEARRILEDNRSLFAAGDPWVAEVSSGLDKFGLGSKGMGGR